MRSLINLQWFSGGVPKLITGGLVNITYPTGTPYIYGNSITPTWNAYPKAKLYRIQLEVFGGALVEEKTTTDLTCTFTGITDEYYVIKIRAENGLLYTDWSTEYFEIENVVDPIIESPTDGRIYYYGSLPDTVAILGTYQSYYETYYFQVYTGSDVLVSEGEGGAGGTAEQYEATISSYGKYKCRVRAKVAGGVYGAYSAYNSFTVEP